MITAWYIYNSYHSFLSVGFKKESMLIYLTQDTINELINENIHNVPTHAPYHFYGIPVHVSDINSIWIKL